MEIISNIALISINETLIVQLISFLIFVFVINRIMFRPLQTVMDERSSYMEALKNDTAQAEAEMTRLTNDLREKEAAARSEAMALKNDLENSGNQSASEISDHARQQISELKDKTAREIEAQIETARKDLSREAEQLAVSVMEKILNRRLTT